MGGQPVEFFGDIAFLRQQYHFLFEALRVQFGTHFGAAIEQFLPLQGKHLRHLRAQGGGFLGDGIQALVDQPGQFFAFTLAAVPEFGQRLVKQRQGGIVECLRIGRIADQHARPAQYFQWVERRGLLDQRRHGLGCGDQLTGALAVDLHGAAAAVFGEAQRAFHLAARKPLAQGVAHRAFEIAKGFRQAQVGFEVTMVDRADFPAEGAVVTGLFGAGEGGHAVDHRVNLSVI